MSDQLLKINQILSQIEILSKRQNEFEVELNNLKEEVGYLQASIGSSSAALDPSPTISTEYQEPKPIAVIQAIEPKIEKLSTVEELMDKMDLPKIKSDFEKFVGENLINKIGIAITVVGVSFGAKYAIDHQLISPLTRIVLGYLFGLGLVGFAIYLKAKYHNFSAVLLSGAMAILYFMTYAAYSFYGLIPQSVAFIMMALITAFTVFAALKYDKQLIAHIGLVGAYLVPFVLSEGSGQVVVLFTYMAIINVGILITAFKKYWKPLYYVSFVATWFIYFSWFSTRYNHDKHFTISLLFAVLFFVIFYITFLSNRLIKNEKFDANDGALILANSFLFYGFGYAILNEKPATEGYLGVFTLLNALLHFIVCVIVFRRKLADKSVFYLISGLVLLFITLAVPVQLNGNWVTLFWAAEATLLFWLGKTKGIQFYEKLALILFTLAFGSIIQDWVSHSFAYDAQDKINGFIPIFNIDFLSAFLLMLAFAYINFLHANKNYSSVLDDAKSPYSVFRVFIPAFLLVICFTGFAIEISKYWSHLFDSTRISKTLTEGIYPDYEFNYFLKDFETVWLINYSLFFFSVLAFVNFKYLKHEKLSKINFIGFLLSLLLFLTVILYNLSELSNAYFNQTGKENFKIGSFYIGLRYVSIAFVTLALLTFYRYILPFLKWKRAAEMFDVILYSTILWIGSSELVQWINIYDPKQSYKLGLSIFWGLYALAIVGLGIWKNKKHLRIGAIVWFGITLLKLFFYDLRHLDSLSKTIVLVSLGIILLVISFLYNKYKHIIGNETET